MPLHHIPYTVTGEAPDAALARLQAETQRMFDDLTRVIAVAVQSVAQDGAR